MGHKSYEINKFLFFFFFFFFQAEDGIRDFCLSRGLGDVYKETASSPLARNPTSGSMM